MPTLKNMEIIYNKLDKVLIVGSGIAGMKAALEAKKLGLDPIIFN
jgi:thioredoxin reductase